jgi:MFS family permease
VPSVPRGLAAFLFFLHLDIPYFRFIIYTLSCNAIYLFLKGGFELNSKWTLLRNRNFMFYFSGYLLSILGDAVFTLSVSWMIVQITGSGILMGSYLMAMGIPRTLLMIFGGVIVDRSNPRLIMIGSDCMRAAVLIALLLLSTDGFPPIWSLFVLAILFGTADALYWPASGAFQQRVVTPDLYSRSNSFIVGAGQMNSILGPLLGAGLLAIGGFRMAMMIDSLTFIVSAGTLLYVKLVPLDGTAIEKPEKRSFKAELIEGFRFIYKSPIILTMIIVSFVANLGSNGISVGLPFLANQLAAGSVGFSHMNAGWGLGGLAGAILFAVFAIRNPSPRMAMVAFLLQGGLLFMLRFTQNHWQATGLLAFAGICSVALQIILPTIYQKEIPKALMGRVMSVTWVISMGSTPLAQAGAGWVIETSGLNSILTIGGMIEIVSAVIAFFLPAIRFHRQRQDQQPSMDNTEATV